MHVVVENLIAVLVKCRQEKNVHYAKCLHAYMCEQELESHRLLGNHLVPVFVECGCLIEAQYVFDRLAYQKEYSWTSLIRGYLDRGKLERAFELYHKLQEEECVQPTRYTYFALLNACAKMKDAAKGRIIHADIAKRGFETDVYVGSTLVDMYCKCSFLSEACQIFDRLPDRNVVSWNALIAGFMEQGFSEEVGNCIWQMQSDGFSPDSFTFVCSLRACGAIMDPETGQKMHAETIKRGFEGILHIGSALVDMHIKFGFLVEAQQTFDRLPARDVVSWAALVGGYAQHGLGEEVSNCFKQMQLEGIPPDFLMYVCSLKACGTVDYIDIGRELHAETTKRGFEWELQVGSTLVDMYTKCGLFAEAREVFRHLPVQNAVSWNALMSGYAECGHGEEVRNCIHQMQLDGLSPDSFTFASSMKACVRNQDLKTGQIVHDETTKRGVECELHVGSSLVDMYIKCGLLADARRVFNWLPSRDAVLWAALIAGYADYELHEEVLSCFRAMKAEGVAAVAVSLVFCLKACGSTGASETGKEIHICIKNSGFERDLLVGSMLIEMYGKCGLVAEGREVFDSLPVRDVVSWTAMIKVYGENHKGQMAIQCFEDMLEQGVKPDSVVFTSLLAACSHASLLLKGQEYFQKMREVYEIEPTLDHYACMVDLFARSGLIHEAERCLATMTCSPSRGILLALLSACKNHGKVESGQQCFQLLVEMNEEDASAYLLVIEMYANAGRWCDANRIEAMKNHVGAKKKPGSAIVEINTNLHPFVVGVRNQNEHAAESFKILSSCMKDEGYVPIIETISRDDCEQKFCL